PGSRVPTLSSKASSPPSIASTCEPSNPKPRPPPSAGGLELTGDQERVGGERWASSIPSVASIPCPMPGIRSSSTNLPARPHRSSQSFLGGFMRSLWIATGYCFLNQKYHRDCFDLAQLGNAHEQLGELRKKIFLDHLTPSRQELMFLWEFLTRTRFDDQLGPLPVSNPDADHKFTDVRGEWLAAGNPEIGTGGEQIQLAAAIGFASLDVKFRDALLAAADAANPKAGVDKVQDVLLNHEADWGRFVLESGEPQQLHGFLVRIQPMGLGNPLEIFHQKAWIQPRKAACPTGATTDSDAGFAFLSHSAFLRQYLDLDPDPDAKQRAQRLVGLLRETGVLIGGGG